MIDIKCLVYLLAGEKDDITPKEQVFNAEKRLGTAKSKSRRVKIIKKVLTRIS
jgi:poly(3-hydroxyalkanoate) synthetase